ncbi:methyltransferase domain-containing protein [Haloechinothrix sp. YIM 98757]|uniref:Methyltransferase domain-containing protein n=1 Tax=Haloechinothrix aidingensis TaxID=2752311 RepID=A0A838AAW9_9PSEU|nr:class I SAM-dependent methyltransferase [Haloechinothrix aidingensis]MBA0126384.1 methyltransferase domain-containing protein [Haloechinothrix aidingensis]
MSTAATSAGTTDEQHATGTVQPSGAVDEQRVADFEERVVDILNHGALSLMLSAGHRTGLLDAMAETGPAGIEAIAEHAGLNQRYVTEWLGAMTVGAIVEHDPDTGTYTLPAEHAQLLTRVSGGDNLAAFAQYIPLLGGVEDRIVECFHRGGGVDYAEFGRFHEVMEEDSAQTVLSALREHILPLVPGLTERLTDGIRVIDVGCGRGRALNDMASWFPRSTFVGYDLSAEAIAYARDTAAERGLGNVSFSVEDAARLAEVEPAGSADLVTTFDAVHDQADPSAVVRGIRHALAEDGVYLAQDIDASSTHHGDREHPLGPLLYTLSCLHCMTVSLARGGAGLGAMWGRERARAMFESAGFTDVQIHTLDHDPQNAYYICRP